MGINIIGPLIPVERIATEPLTFRESVEVIDALDTYAGANEVSRAVAARHLLREALRAVGFLDSRIGSGVNHE